MNKNEVKLGSLINGSAIRDAIHIAVMPAKMITPGRRGDWVGIDENGDAFVIPEGCTWAESKKRVGVIDPYLNGRINSGDLVYICLTPYTITSLRHVWTHPTIPDENKYDPTKDEQYIQYCADEAGLDYQSLMDAADNYLEYDDYLCDGGRWYGFSLPEGFWPAFERITGKSLGDKDGHFFSCSC